jgi:hypothetical protein
MDCQVGVISDGTKSVWCCRWAMVDCRWMHLLASLSVDGWCNVTFDMIQMMMIRRRRRSIRFHNYYHSTIFSSLSHQHSHYQWQIHITATSHQRAALSARIQDGRWLGHRLERTQMLYIYHHHHYHHHHYYYYFISTITVNILIKLNNHLPSTICWVLEIIPQSSVSHQQSHDEW